MKKDLSKLATIKRFATCALAVVVVATSTPSNIAYASSVNDAEENVETVVEEVGSTATNTEEVESTKVSALAEGAVSSSFGSKEIQLEEGTYTVAVAMKNASNLSADSMAAGALAETAVLTVSETGDATLQTTWQTLTAFGISANLTKLSVYQSNAASGDLVEATIDTTREVESGTVPENISFTIPSDMKGLDGVFVFLETDLDGMNNPAWIAIDYEIISLDESSIEIASGDTQKINVTLSESISGQTVVFSSSNTDVATVDAEGNVTAVAQGTATITATVNGASVTCQVTVTEADAEEEEETISLDKSSIAIKVGATEKLIATHSNEEAEVEFSSDNTDVATVDAEGNVTAVAQGSAIITATANGVFATCEVTVTANEEEEDIVELEEGYYSVDAELWHATNAAISSANSALVSTYLEVDAEGVATVYLNLKPLGSVWVDQVKYPVGDDFADAEITKTDADGNPTQWKFALPENVEFTPIQVSYDTGTSYGRMTHTTRLKIDFNSLTQVYRVAEGYYSVDAELWHATNEALSSANSALVGTYVNADAEGVVTVYLNLKPLGSVWVDQVKYPVGDDFADAEITKTDADGNPTQWKFVLPENVDFTPIQVSYDTGTSYGRMTHTTRLKIDFNSLSSINLNFGTDNIRLFPGSYLVPVQLMNASSLVDPSMASLALESAGILTVDDDGNAILQTKWKTLQVGTVDANLIELGVFPNNDTSDINAVQYATVDTYRVSNSTNVPEKISFQIPEEMKNEAGVYVYTKTDIDHNNPAYLVIDYKNAVTSATDKTSLDAALTNARNLNTTGTYITSSLAKLTEAINAAQLVYDNELALQSEIDAQVTALNNAINGLVKTANKTALNTTLTNAKALTNANGIYLAASFSNLTAAINTAQAVYNNADATQSEVDAQVTALNNAVNGLVKAADKTALSTALTNAKAITNANGIYLATSFSNLTTAINTAQAVYNNANATQSEVNAQVTALNNAISALQKSSISLNQTSATIYTKIGTTTVNLTATVVGDNKSVTWTSSNNAIATVDANGKITAKAAGTATITASANGVSANAQITVKAPSLTLTKTSGTVAVGGKITIAATSDPAGKITYKTSNKKVATVTAKGVVKGIKVGTAKITVTSNGISKTYKVTVKKQKLTLKKASGTVTAGKTITIKATASPTGTITYKSSNKKVATVTSKGVVKGIKAGTATITVKCNGVSKTYKVTVKKQTLTLKATSATVKVGKTVAIKATASPKGTITYKSSNTKIATVTSKGVVKGIKKGTTKIKVTCNGVSKTYKVTVK